MKWPAIPLTILIALGAGSGRAAAPGDRALAALAELRWRRPGQADEVPPLVAQALEELQSAQASASRPGRAGLLFIHGEVHRLAAEALAADNPARAEYARAAIEAFRRLRVEFRDISAGGLGYIGEARVRRAHGEFGAADAALRPLLAGHSGLDPQLVRLAVLEAIETELARDPQQVMPQVKAASRRPEFRGEGGQAWQARLDWLAGRALAALADDRQAVQAAAEMLRREGVAAAAPARDRWAILAKLDAAYPPVMDPHERLGWANELLVAGRKEEALDHLRRAAEEAPQALSADQCEMFGRVLLDRQRPAEAADWFDRALSRMSPTEPRRSDVLRLAAWARWLVAREDGEHTPRAAAALLDVVTSDAAGDVRRAALRQWVSLCIDRQPAALLTVLDDHRDLTDNDPLMRYVALRARWMQARDTPADDERLRSLAMEASQVHAVAAAADDHALAASASLLHAMILGDEGAGDLHAALGVLESTWSSIAQVPAVASQALVLRIEWLLALGLVDSAAMKAAEAGSEAALPPALLLKLAAAMAERYDPSMPDAQRRRAVSSLVHRALTSAAGRSDFQELKQGAAATLLRVQAFFDVQSLTEHAEAGAPSLMLRARALRGAGDVDGAVAVIEQFLESGAPSSAAYMELGAIRASLDQHELALRAYRSARTAEPQGSEPWWEATLAVIQMLQRLDRTGDARDLLRVARALYRRPDRPTLQSRVDAVHRELERKGVTP
jgi:tetratricopeptide (TPR) repeat protein